MRLTIDIPKIPEEEKSELVVLLLEIIRQQGEIIQELKDEIARLKGHNPKPTIKPSKLEPAKQEKPKGAGHKRPGSDKRHKSVNLVIHDEIKVPPAQIPEGSRFKGYKEFIVQDLRISPHNVKYLLECWKTPDGGHVIADPPAETGGKHFGMELVRFILYQYYHCHVTQPLLLEQLREIGVDISAGHLNNILTENKGDFHQEKEDILAAALEVSSYVSVDDTGARHQGKNGYCTHIGNEWFSWFESTESKSRINFLRLLRAGRTDYVINSDAVTYWESHKLSQAVIEVLVGDEPRVIADDLQWDRYLEQKGIKAARHIQIATEGALFASIIEHGISRNLIIVSDDAGQFNVLLHALCWIHAERSINKISNPAKVRKDVLYFFANILIRLSVAVFKARLRGFRYLYLLATVLMPRRSSRNFIARLKTSSRTCSSSSVRSRALINALKRSSLCLLSTLIIFRPFSVRPIIVVRWSSGIVVFVTSFLFRQSPVMVVEIVLSLAPASARASCETDIGPFLLNNSSINSSRSLKQYWPTCSS